MTARTVPEAEDRIVQYVEQHPGTTAWAIGMLRSMGMSARGIGLVLERLEAAGRVSHVDRPTPTGFRRLWYPTWSGGRA